MRLVGQGLSIKGAILFDIDSLCGTVNGIPEATLAIRDATKGAPVYVFTHGMMSAAGC